MLLCCLAACSGAIIREVRGSRLASTDGSWEGMPLSDVMPQLTELNAAWVAGQTDVAVGGDGETPDALLKRAQAALWRDGLMGSMPAGRHLVAVAHSTFNQAVLADATGLGLRRLGDVKQANCCVNVLDYHVESGSVHVVATNIKLPE